MEERERLFIESSCKVEPVSSFENLGIRPEVLSEIINSRLKIAHNHAMPLVLSNRSLFLVSPPGSGRGSVTMIGILNSIDYNLNHPQAIVLSPTKELAEEYLESLKLLGKKLPLTTVLCSGGTNVDFRLLKSHVIVGTCGKIIYLVEKNHLDLNYLKIFVCDIANKLFKDPMANEIEHVLGFVRKPCVYWFLSPTQSFPAEESFLRRAQNPVSVKILRDERALSEVTFYAKITDSEKEQQEFIVSLAYSSPRQMVIFGGHEDKLEVYEEFLKDLSSVYLSTSFTKLHRKAILEDFKNQVTKVLICESKSSLCRKIEAKGPIDVINLNIPKRIDMFLMRMRRFNYYPDDKVYIVVSQERYESLRVLAGDLALKIVLY